MIGEYLKLSTGDIIQLDDIIHISKISYSSHGTIYFSILYAGQERVNIEYNTIQFNSNNEAKRLLKEDREKICKKIGVSC